MPDPTPAFVQPQAARAASTGPTAHPFHALEAGAARHPERTAVTGSGRGIAYAALHDACAMLAGYLQQHLEVRRGDRVLVLLPDSLACIEAIYAVLRCDAVAVVVPASSTIDAVARCVADTGCRVAITAQPLLAAVMPLLAGGLAGCIVEAGSGALADDRRLHDLAGAFAAGIAPMAMAGAAYQAAVLASAQCSDIRRVAFGDGHEETGIADTAPLPGTEVPRCKPGTLALAQGLRAMHDAFARGHTVVLDAAQ